MYLSREPIESKAFSGDSQLPPQPDPQGPQGCFLPPTHAAASPTRFPQGAGLHTSRPCAHSNSFLPSFIHSLIHPFSGYLLSTSCVPGTGLGARDTAEIRHRKSLELTAQWWGDGPGPGGSRTWGWVVQRKWNSLTAGSRRGRPLGPGVLPAAQTGSQRSLVPATEWPSPPGLSRAPSCPGSDMCNLAWLLPPLPLQRQRPQHLPQLHGDPPGPAHSGPSEPACPGRKPHQGAPSLLGDTGWVRGLCQGATILTARPRPCLAPEDTSLGAPLLGVTPRQPSAPHSPMLGGLPLPAGSLASGRPATRVP